MFHGGDQVNSVPAKAMAMIKGNIRTIPIYSNKMILNALGNLVANLNKKTEL